MLQLMIFVMSPVSLMRIVLTLLPAIVAAGGFTTEISALLQEQFFHVSLPVSPRNLMLANLEQILVIENVTLMGIVMVQIHATSVVGGWDTEISVLIQEMFFHVYLPNQVFLAKMSWPILPRVFTTSYDLNLLSGLAGATINLPKYLLSSI